MPTVSAKTLVILIICGIAISTACLCFIPIYTSSMIAIKNIFAEMRSELSKRVTTELSVFFSNPMGAIQNVRGNAKLGYINALNWTSVTPQIIEFSLRYNLDTYVGNSIGQMFMCTNGPSPFGELPPETGTAMAVKIGPTFYTWEVNRTTLSLGRNIGVKNSSYDPRRRPWYGAISAKQVASWSNVYINVGDVETAITAGFPIFDVFGSQTGVFAVDVTTKDLLTFLGNVKLGKTGIVVLLETLTRSVLGTSFRDKTTVVDGGSVRLTRVGDFNNSLLARCVANIGEESLFTMQIPVRTSFGTGRDVVYLDITQITDDFGLDLRLLFAVPEIDFVSDVYKQTDIAIGSVAACTLVLVGVCIGLTWLLFQPLVQLQERMIEASTLDDDGKFDSISNVTEIRSMQSAYSNLVGQLSKLRSYMPQTIIVDEEFEPDEKVSVSRQSVKSNKPHLNIELGLKLKEFSFLVFNLRNTTGTMAADVVQSRIASVLNVIQATISETKGVFDFHGDHVFISYNACKPCASHALSSVESAINIHNAIETVGNVSHSIGIATGRSLVGNIGTDMCTRFSVIGTVYSMANTLERACKTRDTWLLVSNSTTRAAQFDYKFICLDSAPLAYTVMNRINHGDNEWLYNVDQPADEISRMNDAIKEYAGGKAFPDIQVSDAVLIMYPSLKDRIAAMKSAEFDVYSRNSIK